MALFRKNGFVLLLLGAVALAWGVPEFGAPDGPLRAELLARIGVMVVFFLQGLTLRTRELAQGVGNIRLHLLVQGWIFLGSAIIHGAASLALKAMGYPDLAAGFIYLALLPTTITSAILFTSAANGNVSGAIFNTTLANVIGVFWVPLGCLLLFTAGSGFPADMVLGLLLKVARLILLPLVIGQLLRPLVSGTSWFKKISRGFKYINHGIILFIVYSTLSQSFLSNAWSGIGGGVVLFLLGLTLLAVLLVHGLVWLSSGRIVTRPGDRITALFCGSQKTLAAGAPMAVAIFSTGEHLARFNIGLLLLPLLCYHPIQLFLAALILPKFDN